MKLSCIIVEDEPMARDLLSQYIDKVPSLDLQAAFSNPLEALEYLKEHEPDVLFLDVQMPEITGISLLKILKRKPIVIMSTAYSEYAIEGFELDVTDYLLKPVTFERFLKAVERATERRQASLALEHNTTQAQPQAPLDTTNPPAIDFIFVKDGAKMVKVRIKDIQYIEGLKDYVRIHTPKGRITTLQRLKSLETQLPNNAFFRVHHSYIVAIEWIDVIHRDKLEIDNQTVPISDTYRKAFKSFIDHRSMGRS
ncbi:MAG: LytTR family DNA-binding domain-containing protein [Saprospiraceae bacterium]|nr:LytTR family DNA-binding domain-containing protein [Saprospiraceae bacterium]